MKRLILFGIALAALLISGCKKDNTDPQDDSSKFWSFLDQMKKSPKTYMVQSYSGPYTKPENNYSQWSASIEGNREPWDLTVDERTLSFRDHYYNQGRDVSIADTSLVMPEIYGKEYALKFTENSLEAKSDGSISNPEGQVYMPESFYPVVFDQLSGEEEVIAGTIVKWKKDDKNENDVLMKIEYSPGMQSDSLNRINFPDYISRSKLVKDIGEYTFGASDFADFPPNADLDFSINRVGYTTFREKNGDDCTIACLVISSDSFTISIGE